MLDPCWLSCNVGELGSIPGLGRSSGEGNGYPLKYSCLENPRNRGPPLSPSYHLGRRLQDSSLEKGKGPKDMNSRHWGCLRRAQDKIMN